MINCNSEAVKGFSKVLCVEDDADIRALLILSLSEIGGLTVQCHANGTQALAAIPTFDPDLVLLDVMMPGLSGPDVLAAIRRQPQTQHVPVVFLTAKAMPAELERLLDLQATGVIVKPFDPLSLAADLTMYFELDRRALARQPSPAACENP